jgi:hypothetical protein
MRYTKQELAFAILRVYHNAEPRGEHKYTALGGKGDYPGTIEHLLNTTFTDDERAAAGRTFNDLEARGYIMPTYKDIIEPGNWLRITPLGEQALQSGALDELDDLLLALQSTDDLLQLRYGAYEAVAAQNTDWQRHASTSCRELITKVLHTVAPDADVKADPQFVPDKNSTSGITRRHRIKYYLRQRSATVSKSDLAVIENAGDLIEACYAKLSAVTHTSVQEAENLIKLTENALLFLLRK